MADFDNDLQSIQEARTLATEARDAQRKFMHATQAEVDRVCAAMAQAAADASASLGKMANVEVVYAKSFYAGAKHTSGKWSGEIMAILAGPDPAEVRAGLNAAVNYIKTQAIWYSANDDDSIAFFPHVISRTGTYLSQVCNIPVGSPIAYLVATPNEGLVALDAALKSADVSIVALTMPPSETNYMGVMLTGDQPACKAAAMAFQNKVLEVASNPINY